MNPPGLCSAGSSATTAMLPHDRIRVSDPHSPYLLAALQNLEQQWCQRHVHPLFGPGHLLRHPGIITGGPYGAMVPFFISEFCRIADFTGFGHPVSRELGRGRFSEMRSRIEYSILYPPDVGADVIKAGTSPFIGRSESLDPWSGAHPAELSWRFDRPRSVLAADYPFTPSVAASRPVALAEPAHVGPKFDLRVRRVAGLPYPITQISLAVRDSTRRWPPATRPSAGAPGTTSTTTRRPTAAPDCGQACQGLSWSVSAGLDQPAGVVHEQGLQVVVAEARLAQVWTEIRLDVVVAPAAVRV